MTDDARKTAPLSKSGTGPTPTTWAVHQASAMWDTPVVPR